MRPAQTIMQVNLEYVRPASVSGVLRLDRPPAFPAPLEQQTRPNLEGHAKPRAWG